jgi:hypothetical protein
MRLAGRARAAVTRRFLGAPVEQHCFSGWKQKVEGALPPRFSRFKTRNVQGRLSQRERMMGLEPTTFCMATRPDTRTLVQQPHG